MDPLASSVGEAGNRVNGARQPECEVDGVQASARLSHLQVSDNSTIR
jgi:hypothetical protein